MRRGDHGTYRRLLEGDLMRDEAAIRDRIAELEAEYDVHDPPLSPADDTTEVALLRAIEELEWVLEERSGEGAFTG